MTRHQPEALRRAAILAAARQVFSRDGFERTHLDEVARLAELSKGSLYLHFESKELLYREVLESALQRWREPWSYMATEAADSAGPPEGVDPSRPTQAVEPLAHAQTAPPFPPGTPPLGPQALDSPTPARTALKRRIAVALHTLSAGQEEAKIVSDAWHRASSDRSIAALLAPHRAALHLDLCRHIGLARHERALALTDVPARAELLVAVLIGLVARRPEDASPQGLATDAALAELLLEWACGVGDR